MTVTRRNDMETFYNELYNRFKKLSPIEDENSEFSVVTISRSYPHKIGMTSEGYPMLFVECLDEKDTTDINLKLFKVSFNQLCQLREREVTYDKKYTIIQLNSNNIDFQKYFLEVMCLIFEKLPSKPTVEQLKKEVSKLISMFTGNPTISKEVVKGLWAELFIIERAKDTEYLIDAWHVSPEDKYDFNDGVDKIEVKATSNVERVHHFAIEQLNPNKESQLLIASCIVISTGIGESIFDLVDKISKKITNIDLVLKLKEIVMKTIGGHFNEVRNLKFDYSFAKDNLKWFDYKTIPAIKLSSIPESVTNVHFASCLKNIKETNYKATNSKLYKAL